MPAPLAVQRYDASMPMDTRPANGADALNLAGRDSAAITSQAAKFAHALVVDAPQRIAWVVALLLATSVTEAFGILMLLPLLELAGMGGAGGEVGALVGMMRQAAGALGVELTLSTVLGVFLVLAAVRSAAAWQRDVLMVRTQLEFVDRFRARFYRAIAQAEWEELSRHRSSELQNVLTVDVARASLGAKHLLNLMSTLMLTAAQITLALLISPLITAVAIGIGACLLGIVYPLAWQAARLGTQLTGANRDFFATVSEFLAGLRFARSHDAEALHVRRFTDQLAAVRGRRVAFVRANATARAIIWVASAAAVVALVWFTARAGGAALPELLIVVLIFGRLLPVASALQQCFLGLVNALPAYTHAQEAHQRLAAAAQIDAMAEPPGHRVPESMVGRAAPRPADDRMALRHTMTLKDVSFQFHAAEGRLALDQVDLAVAAGAITVVTGPSGAGKSTLADILAAVLAPTRGAVFVDGTRLTASNRRRWRSSIAYVPQEPYLFHDTIRANLKVSRPEASDWALERALRRAGAEGFVHALPKRLDTVIGEGAATLSGGERQRLTLARALLREPTLLVLDEATSHLEPDTERLIAQVLAALRGTMTIVAIAHGGLLPAVADAVVRLEAGRIVHPAPAAAAG